MGKRVRYLLASILVIAGLVLTTTAAHSLRPRSSGAIPEVGVSVVFDDHQTLAPDNQVVSHAQSVLRYVASLGANAVSLDFPFYNVGQSPADPAVTASAVTSGPGTPSPQLLGAVIRMAHEDGLTVQLRPLLSQEGDSGIQFRGNIEPTDPAAWLRSYWHWLRPYVVEATLTGVASISVGAELKSLVAAWTFTDSQGKVYPAQNNLSYWEQLDLQVKSIFGPHILYSGNHHLLRAIPGIGFGYDAYTPIAIPIGAPTPTSSTPTATVVNEFESGIKSNNAYQTESSLLTTGVEEVGIPAVDGAWTSPPSYNYRPGTPVARWVQADWITANCDAFLSQHMPRLFVWSLEINGFDASYNADAANNPYSIQSPLTIAAITNCFAQAKAGG